MTVNYGFDLIHLGDSMWHYQALIEKRLHLFYAQAIIFIRHNFISHLFGLRETILCERSEGCMKIFQPNQFIRGQRK